jgi:hypothetical protein
VKPFRALLLYLAVVFLGGATLAPWVYLGAQKVASILPAFGGIAGQPFHRYVNRCLYAVALAGLWPLLKALQIRSTREIGLGHPNKSWRPILFGFITGFLTLAFAAFLALTFGARQPNSDLTLAMLAKLVLKATTSSLVVAFLEELMFRGVAFGGLRKSLVPGLALLLSASLYSVVHFYERPAAPETVTWFTGFETLVHMFEGIADSHQLVPGFFSLLTAGMILGWAFHSSGTLWFSIGLHAGWVFWLKSYSALTVKGTTTDLSYWGTGRLYDGWLAFAILVTAGLVLRWRMPPPRGVIQWK